MEVTGAGPRAGPDSRRGRDGRSAGWADRGIAAAVGQGGEAEAAPCPEMRSFAEGIRADEAAVDAAVTEAWSNGPVEGHVNRLKAIKRQMYGRAGFRLLRARVVHAA